MTIKASENEVCIEHPNEDSASSYCCETEFSEPVVDYLIGRIGYADLANAIGPFEHVHAILKAQLFSYFRPEEFRGKRLLDFGSGFGVSTCAIAKMLPSAEVCGVELVPERIEIAQTVAALQKVGNVKFLCSPSGDRLPDEIGQFDYVILCAVYEHLLPHERKTLMPLLWSAMKEGAAIFINRTPYRYFPIEHHSTGLWFINYAPDSLAHFIARKFARHDPVQYSRAIQKSPIWEDHLRGGIRGATEWEIIRNLNWGSSSKAHILQPRAECARDRADYWFQRTGQKRFRLLKRALASTFRITDKFLDTVPSMNVDVVIQKEARLKAKS